MKEVIFQRTIIPEMRNTALVLKDGVPVDPESDEFAIAMILDMLIEHGRKKGVHGTVKIPNIEAVEFAQEIQRRAASRLPNGGVGMNIGDIEPVLNEETEKMLDGFWSKRTAQ